jgi:hypothetical protein
MTPTFFQKRLWGPGRPRSAGVAWERGTLIHTEYLNLFWILRTGVGCFDRRQYFGLKLWNLGVTSLKFTGSPDYRVTWVPSYRVAGRHVWYRGPCTFLYKVGYFLQCSGNVPSHHISANTFSKRTQLKIVFCHRKDRGSSPTFSNGCQQRNNDEGKTRYGIQY